MQSYGYESGKNIEMKNNTLEHLFDFAPLIESSSLLKINFLKQRNTKNDELTFVTDLATSANMISVFNTP